MMHRLLCLLATTGIATALVSTLPAEAAGAFRKMPANMSSLKSKKGYWMECRYTGLGEECYYVYARGKNGKFHRLSAAVAKPKVLNDYVQVCYDGGNNSTICYWVYQRVR